MKLIGRSNNCPICNSYNVREFFHVEMNENDKRYHESALIKFAKKDFIHFKCNSCHFVYLPKPENMILDEYYNSEYYRTNFCNIEKEQFKEFTDKIVKITPFLKGKKILDIGCALGISLKAYTAKGYQAYGMENSEFAVNMARKNTTFTVMQQSIENKTNWENDFFDGITMVDVLEHLSNPIFALKEANRVLKNGGILYIHTLNFNGIGRKIDKMDWTLLNPPAHLSYFTPRTLRYALNNMGFSIIQMCCPSILSKKKPFQYINGVITNRFPKIGKIVEFMKVGDIMYTIAKKN